MNTVYYIVSVKFVEKIHNDASLVHEKKVPQIFTGQKCFYMTRGRFHKDLGLGIKVTLPNSRQS